MASAVQLTFIICLVTGITQALQKRWIPNTNLENPQNWNMNRTPCSMDKVLLPESTGTLFLSNIEFSAEEIILPADGVLAFGEGASLGVSVTDPDETCEGGVIQFAAVEPVEWLDPHNWCEVHDGGNCLDKTRPRLDVETVPCISDEVIFPRDSGFLLTLNTTVTIASLELRGRSIERGQWTDYDPKEFTFTDEGKVMLTGEICRDPQGCTCINDALMPYICALQTPCPRPACKNSMQPLGHCCNICGAILHMTFTKTFKYADFERLLKAEVAENSKADIIISRSGNKTVQVVVVDYLDGNDASQVAHTLEVYVVTDISKGESNSKLGIESLTVQWSGERKGGRTSALTSTPKGQATLAGIILLILIVCALFALATVCYKRRHKYSGRRFGLRFFRNDSSDGDAIQMTEAHAIPIVDFVTDSDLPTSFGNPMFEEQPVDQLNELKPKENNNETDLRSATNENPLEVLPTASAPPPKASKSKKRKNRKQNKSKDKTAEDEQTEGGDAHGGSELGSAHESGHIQNKRAKSRADENVGSTVARVEMDIGGADGDIASFSNPLYGAEISEIKQDEKDEEPVGKTVFLNPTYDYENLPDSEA